MSPAGETIRAALERVRRRVRRDAWLALLAAAAAVPAVTLLLAYGAGAWGLRGAGPLAAVTCAALTTVGVAVALRHLWLGPLTEAAIAAAAERSRGLPEGALRGVVELARELPPGVSGVLFGHAEAQLAGHVEGQDAPALAGELGSGVRRRRTRVLSGAALLGLVVIAAGFASPRRAAMAWKPLLHPVSHLRGPALPPLTVSPGDASVERGGALDVEVEAPLRREAALHWRAVGDVPRDRKLEVNGGQATASLGPIRSPVVYWVSAPDGAATDSFHVTPIDPLLLSELAVDVGYPAYTGRPADHYEGEVPRLSVPEGTVLRVRGSATRPLASLSLVRGDGRMRAAGVEGRGFEMDWTVDAGSSGRWAWRLRGTGSAAAGVPSPLELEVTADAAPEVRITSPAPDTVMPPGLQQGVGADASDDFGLSSASLVYRRVPATGAPGPEHRSGVPLAAGEARALLRTVLDASGETLVPGDVVEYRIEVVDNAPSGQVGRSATQTLRVPGMSELREGATAAADRLLAATEALSRDVATLEKTTRDLSRRAAGEAQAGRRGGTAGGGDGQPLSFQDASEAAEVLREQEALLDRAALLSRQLAELRAAAERAGLDDPDLRRKLAELEDLYRRAQLPETRQESERLRKAVEALDAEAVQKALDKLAEQQAELKQQLAEDAEAARRTAAEQKLSALAREAEEIAGEQRVLAASMAPDSTAAAPRPAADAQSSPAAASPLTGTDSAGTASPQTAAGDTTATSASRSTAGAAQEDSTAAGERGRRSPPQGGAPADSAPGDSAQADSASAHQPGGENGSHPSGGGKERRRQQEELQDRTKQLTQSLESLQQQLLQMGEQGASGQTGSARKKTESAQQSMGKAGQQSERQQGQQASTAGKQAAAEMSSAAQTLDAARREMTEARRQAAQQAVRQATQDALELAQRQEQLRQQMEAAQQNGSGGDAVQQMASQQETLQQGLEQLGQNLSEAGERSAGQDRQVAQSLARATLDMQRTVERLDADEPLPTDEAGRAVEALNQLAMSLLQSDGRLQPTRGGGVSQETLEQLGQLAKEQGSLNQQVGAVAGMELDTGARSQALHQAAEAQRGIARRVGDLSGMMGGEEGLRGRLSQLTTDASAIARQLEQGRLDGGVTRRQEELFRHLLDAGRTMERDEYSDQRESRSAEDGPVSTPSETDPALLDGALRYPPPTAEQLRGLPPAYRRMILDYFERLNRPGKPETRP